MQLTSTHRLERGQWIPDQKLYDNVKDNCLTFTFIKENLFLVESGRYDEISNNYDEYYQVLIKVKPIE